MKAALNKLPAELQRSLQRWYILSCTALIITLIALAAIHISTTVSLHRLTIGLPSQLAHTPQEPMNALEHDVIQKRLDELDNLIHTKHLFLPLLVACVQAVPEGAIHLTEFTLTAKKTFSCSGQALHADLVTEFVNALHGLGLACTNVNLKTETNKELPILFRIEAKKCGGHVLSH